MRQALPEHLQTGRVQLAKPPHDGVVGDRDRYGGTAQPGGKHHQCQPNQHHCGDQPANPAGPQVMG
jgi:hypothetical protein